MEFSDWLWLKFFALCVIAFAWGAWRGFNGLPLHLEQRERQTRARQSESTPEAHQIRQSSRPTLPRPTLPEN